MSRTTHTTDVETPTTIAEGLSCALPPEELPRRAMDITTLFDRARTRRPIDDGAELTFAGDDAAARDLLDFILAERRCCATLSFELAFIPDHSTVVLRLQGRGEQGASIRAWAGAT